MLLIHSVIARSRNIVVDVLVSGAVRPFSQCSYYYNDAEAYHSYLNAEFYVKHPNIYMFVDVLKKVWQTAYVAMNSLS